MNYKEYKIVARKLGGEWYGFIHSKYGHCFSHQYGQLTKKLVYLKCRNMIDRGL